MADMIHMSLSNFRTSMLTAVACLECELRDRTMHMPSTSPLNFQEDSRVMSLESSMDLLRKTIIEFNHTIVEMGLRIQDMEQKIDILSISQNPCSRNPVYGSQEFHSYRYSLQTEKNEDDTTSIEDITECVVHDTENIESIDIDESAPAGSDEIQEIDETVVVDAEAEPDIDEDIATPCSESVHSIPEENDVNEEEVGNEMEIITIDGIDYHVDNEHNVFTLEEGAEEYTHVGNYDPDEGTVAFLEEEAVEVEEETMEEFVYKGKTYYRDGEQNVFVIDEEAGEYTPIGTWNGKKIIKGEV